MGEEYWEERLHAYIDDELGPADRKAFDTYLSESEEASAEVAYFSCLKRRLRAHSESVEMPASVGDRLESLFEKRRKGLIWRRVTLTALPIAAVLLLGFLMPRFLGNTYLFNDTVMTGHLVCHDCHVAEHAGLDKGVLCKAGHQLGLVCPEGKLYRIAADEFGIKILNDLALYGSEIRVYGQVLKAESMIRIKSFDRLDDRHSLLDGMERVLASQSGRNLP